MDAAAWRRLAPLVDEALDLPDDRRAAFLSDLGERDPELGRELAAFLAAEALSRGFLERPVEERATALLGALAEDARSWDAVQLEGARVGPYRVLRELGRGGMGVVLLAERVDGGFQQQVALKLVRRGVYGPQAFARFAAERQILARLQHPHVARLLDGGVSAQGQPYFAMEHVEGVPLIAACDRQRVDTPGRLRLFLQVCDAVEHAHRNLIVHRDLKPSNILVTPDGQAKLLDFGIARVLEEDDAGGNATLTGAEGRALTPQYAAPEQLRGQPVTTVTDVYSLGVVLHELLCGRPPYLLDGLSYGEIERLVAEKEPIPCSAEIGEAAAAARQRTARQLERDLRGDLDTVVAVALRKEPFRRYASVGALADDLRRHLAGRPVLARGESWTYRVSKFVRRHRVGVAAFALLGLVLAGGVVATVWQGAEARRQARRAEEVKDFTLGLFEMSDPDAAQGRTATARELLDRAAARVNAELADQPDLQAEMLLHLGRIYHRLGLDQEGLPLLEKALQLRQAAAHRDERAVAEAEFALGSSCLALDRIPMAEAHAWRALEPRRRILGPDHADTAAAEGLLGQVESAKGDGAQAEPLLVHAVETLRRRTPAGSEDLGSALSALGLLCQARGDLDRAEGAFRESLAVRRALFGEQHSEVAGSLHNLASVMADRGELQAAATQYRQALAMKRRILGARDHEDLATGLNSLGSTLIALGRYDEAETLLREALAIRQRLYGPDGAQQAQSLHNLSRALRQQGRAAEAEPLSRRALALLAGNDEGRPAVAVRMELAQILRERGQLQEAEALARRALATSQKRSASDPVTVTTSSVVLGQVLVAAGRPGEAEPLLRDAVRLRLARWGAEDWRAAEASLRLAECLAALKRAADASTVLAPARDTLSRRLGPDHPLTKRATALQQRIG